MQHHAIASRSRAGNKNVKQFGEKAHSQRFKLDTLANSEIYKNNIRIIVALN